MGAHRDVRREKAGAGGEDPHVPPVTSRVAVDQGGSEKVRRPTEQRSLINERVPAPRRSSDSRLVRSQSVPIPYAPGRAATFFKQYKVVFAAPPTVYFIKYGIRGVCLSSVSFQATR